MWGRALISCVRKGSLPALPRVLRRSLSLLSAAPHGCGAGFWLGASRGRGITRYDELHRAGLGSILCRRGYARAARPKGKKQRRFKTLRSKKKRAVPCGARRLIPEASIHKKPPGFQRHTDKVKLTVHERKHEEFKQVLSRLEIKQLAWESASYVEKKKALPDEQEGEFRRAANRVNAFETIPTFRKKTDSGPPPISMKKSKRAVTIQPITFEEGEGGRGRNLRFRSKQDQKRLLRRARRPAPLTTDKRN